MPILKVDGLKESDGVVFKTVPTGKYVCRIEGIELKDTKKDNKPMLEFSARICPGQEFSGESQKFWIVLPNEKDKPDANEKHVAALKRVALACGLSVDEDDLNTDDLMGKELILSIREKEEDGEKRNDVKDYLPVE